MTSPPDTSLLYQGLLSLHSYGEADEILFLSSEPEPLADVLDSAIDGKQVTARYWITDSPCTREEAQQDAAEVVMGKAKTDFGSRYSDLTGYLWTDEDVRIGGHDLLDELRSAVGKWLILEIEIHD